MDIGIIGLGRLGGALARGFDRFWRGGEFFGYSRGQEKALAAAALAPRLRLLGSARAVLDRCGIVFLWTKPADAYALLEAEANVVQRKNPIVVSCIAPTEYGRYCARWAETLPNVNMAAGRGVTLVHFPESLSLEDKAALSGALGSVGTVHELPRQEITYYSALASCGPALYAVMMEELADTLSAKRGYDRDFCRALVHETMAGTLAIMDQDGLDAGALVERVAHPGGASEAGLGALREKLPGLYAEMLARMKKC